MLETSNREDKIGEVGNGKIINWRGRAGGGNSKEMRESKLPPRRRLT